MILERHAGQLIAVGLGAIQVMAFAPFNFWWLAILVNAALLGLLTASASPREAALRGASFGLGLFGAGVWWVFISLHDYGQAPWAFAAIATALLVGYLALYPTLLGYFTARSRGWSSAVRWLLVVPALAMLLEWLRSVVLTGFPWLTVGYSQVAGPLLGFAPLGGVLLMSGLTWWLAGLLLLAVDAGRQRQPFRVVIALGAFVATLGAGQGLHTLSWSTPLPTPPLTVALVQGNIDARERWGPDDLTKSLYRYAELSWRQGEADDLIIWPEMAIPALVDDLPPAFVEEIVRDTVERQTDYLVGIADGAWATRTFYNAVIGYGRVRGRYYKRRLVIFGEYLPLRSLLNALSGWVEIPMSDLSPGPADQPLMTLRGLPVGVMVCFDAVFGEEARRSLPTATFLVNLSNDSWFGRSWAAAQHLQIAQLRAAELSRDLIRATNTGHSALIDHRGQIQARTALFEIAVLRDQVQPRTGLTPYGAWGDGPVVGSSLLLLLVLFVAARRRA